MKEQPGSASVVQGVTEDKYGIGYSGIGYKTSGVKALALAARTASAFIEHRRRSRSTPASTRCRASSTST